LVVGAMTAPRKIMFVAGTLGVGGAERQLLYMLRALISRGHEPEVISLEGGVFVERIAQLGVPVTVLARTRGPIGRLVQITRHVRESRPDVLQAAHNWVSAYVAVIGRILSLPAIGCLRSEPAETIESVGLLGHAAVRLPKLIAANSRVSLEASVSLGTKRERLVHLPNAIDTDHFSPRQTTSDNPAGARGDELSVLAVGRLDPRKGFDRYLDVIARLVADPTVQSTVRASLVGSGAERANLEAQAKNLGLTQNVSFHETDQPLGFYRSAEILLFTSGPFEGMPNVVLEAMAVGVAVVGFESGDVTQVLINNETGILVKPNGDVDAMFEAVKLLVSDPPLRAKLVSNARRHLETNYSVDALAENLEQLHERAIDGR